MGGVPPINEINNRDVVYPDQTKEEHPMSCKSITLLTALLAAFPIAVSAQVVIPITPYTDLGGLAGHREFGTNLNRTYVSPLEFHNDYDGSGLQLWNGGYYIAPYGNPYTYYRAPVNFPDGAQLCYMSIYAYDNGASSNRIEAYLMSYEGGIPTIAGTGVVARQATQTTWDGILSYASSGEEFVAINVGGPATGGPPNCITINNDVLHGGHQYAISIFLPAPLNSTSWNSAFKAIEFGWYRAASPAPASATFSDVPSTNTFFAAIEALSAAGITHGCGAGTFCPNEAVTRGQMAAFLSRALGL
jgi:hypothetical protein